MIEISAGIRAILAMLDAMAFKLAGARSCRDVRTAMIFGSQESAIATGSFKMAVLLPGHRDVPLVFRGHFLTVGPGIDSASTAVEAGAVDGRVVDDCSVVGVVDDGHVDIGDGAVVVVVSAAPGAAEEADSGVAESVVNTTVETHPWSPVAPVPNIEAFVPSPVAGGPKQARFRRQYPCAGNPEIAIVSVGPIARDPHIARARTDRLRVDRQRRWAKANGDAHRNLRMRWSGNRQDSGDKDEREK